MPDQRDPIDDFLIGLSLADHMGDVVDEIHAFLRATGRPCPQHRDPYRQRSCWFCGVEGHWDEEQGRFIVTADSDGYEAKP